MKDYKYLLLALLISNIYIFTGCQKTEEIKDISQESTGLSEDYGDFKSSVIYCGDPITGTIVNYEQTINAGTVTVGNDQTDLYVTFEAASGWTLRSTYLYVGPAESVPGSLEPDGSGDFKQWLFPISNWYNNGIDQKTYNISLDELDECFIVVAYCNPQNLSTGDIYLGWGKSDYKTEGYYLDYCKQNCEIPPLGGCESAYAYDDKYSICFITLTQLINGKKWGWTNGPVSEGSFVFDLYAGAGKCDIERGTRVGKVYVNYDGVVAEVEYLIFDGYGLNETHVYVGNDILPKKKNKYTVAPGHYPQKHDNLNGATSDSFIFSNLSGEIYIITHADVCDQTK